MGTWKPCAVYIPRMSLHAEGAPRVYETNCWSKLPGVGHTGASDKNICPPKTLGHKRHGGDLWTNDVMAQGGRVDQEGHLITLYRDGLSYPCPMVCQGAEMRE